MAPVVLPHALYLHDALEQLAVHFHIDLADEKVKAHLKCIRYLGGHLDGGLYLVALIAPDDVPGGAHLFAQLPLGELPLFAQLANMCSQCHT